MAKIKHVIKGSNDRPRLSLFRSSRHIYAQVIDDVNNITLASASSLGVKSKTKSLQATNVSKSFSDILKKKDILRLVFDRAGYPYKGRIKIFVDELRNNGITI